MSENVDNPANEANEPEESGETSGPRGGERLAAARRELQVSVLEIAKELHLDEANVRALERNEFEVLGAPVFGKGHLRKYAQLVNVDAEDIFGDYYEMTRAASLPPVVSTRPKPRQELSPGPWIAVIVVVIVLATGYWWFSRDPAPASEPETAGGMDTSAAESLPVDEAGEDPPPLVDEAVEDPPSPVDEGLIADPEPQPQASPAVIEETQSPEIAPGQVRVLLTYSGDCWTEITDATGRRLFFALGKDGRSVELSGAEPLNVLFGNATNVSVEVNGDDFQLPASARPDRPLRLTISGS